MKLLVTGGLGFIGSNFIQYMLNLNPEIEIVNVDKCDYCATVKNVDDHPRYTYVPGDITDMELIASVFSKYSPTHLVHFAAQSFVDLSFSESFQFTNDNVLGTHVLLEAARKYGKLRRFIHISTDEVYGEVDEHVTCDETAKMNPSNPYSASKAAAELYVQAYTNCYNVPCIITRCNNVFGPKQYPEKVVPIFILQMLNNKPVTIHGRGETKRNFIHVDDVCSAIECILDRGGVGEIYNIGTKFELSVLELYQKLKSVMDVQENIEYVKDPRPHNDSRYCIDSSKLRKLGWKERCDFTQKLKETIDWYFQNAGWWA
jgi:nucleoside-diphosphate-sugar epimerase